MSYLLSTATFEFQNFLIKAVLLLYLSKVRYTSESYFELSFGCHNDC